MQSNARGPAADGASHEKHRADPDGAAANAEPAQEPSTVVEVDASKLYAENSALLGLRVEVSEDSPIRVCCISHGACRSGAQLLGELSIHIVQWYRSVAHQHWQC